MALSYKVFPGTPYYSNTSLTTKAGEIVNTTAATYVNTTYGTVSVGGSTYYVAYGMMVSFWNSSFTGAQIDDALNKVINADTTPTANSTKMITSGGVKSALNNAKALSFTITLTANGWSNNSQTISSAYFVASGYAYTVCPSASNYTAYADAQIYADDVTTNGSMTFHCDSVPSSDLTVNVLRVEASA